MTRNIQFLILALLFFFNCKSPKNSCDFIFKPELFMNISDTEFQNNYKNNLLLKEKIKVIFKDSLISYDEFEKLYSKNKKYKFFILTDSISIAKYNIKNCNILFVVN